MAVAIRRARGALGSLWFIGLMLTQHHFCPYCTVVHAANLAFWAVVETAGMRKAKCVGRGAWRVERGAWSVEHESSPCHLFTSSPPHLVTSSPLHPLTPSSALRPALAAAAVFAGVSAALGIWQSAVRQSAAERAEAEFQASLQQIVAEVRRQNQESGPDPPAVGPLQGRWRRGPEQAALRLVVFGDCECPHCRSVERQIQAATAGRSDVSVVVKHYPLCKDCNRQIKAAHLHDRACRAALAAEAAGLQGGNDAWWRMHDWLLARAARFSDAELRDALPSLGLDKRGGLLCGDARPRSPAPGPRGHRGRDLAGH